MKYYIKLENGNFTADSGPFTEDYMKSIYPDFDPENLPENVYNFKRITRPEIGPYEVFEESTFENINGEWQDVHKIRPMTAEEKETYINERKQQFLDINQGQLEYYNFDKFIFDENLGIFGPPIPMPIDPDHVYGWNGTEWIQVEDPTDLPLNLFYSPTDRAIDAEEMKRKMSPPYRRADAPHWGFNIRTKEWVEIDDVLNPPPDVYSQWGW